jgi:hypothetical protein
VSISFLVLSSLSVSSHLLFLSPFLFSRCPYTVNGIHEPKVIMKDNDLKNKLHMPKEITKSFFQQIQKDSQFLYSIGVMDYSLLIGIHNKEFDVSATASATSSSASPVASAAASNDIKRSSTILLNKAPIGASLENDDTPAATPTEKENKNDNDDNIDVSLNGRSSGNVLLRKHEVLLSFLVVIALLLLFLFLTSYVFVRQIK